ncbi:MAG: methyltransferase domain-containing protein [Proteobacteria bacterium]|nr:methyltransferase domain-containing protein [Pseudomonadota bacterium]
MPAWDPGLYLKFADLRLRPALDLLTRIPHDSPRTVVDLGCGPGRVTRLLQGRWPEALVTGVDASAEMLDRARREAEAEGQRAIRWIAADLAAWLPEEPADVLYSNAAFQWLPDHESLYPRLMGVLAPGGALAVQIPHMTDQPTHRTPLELAASEPWRASLTPLPDPLTDHPAGFYYDLLRPLARRLDIWETTYLQVLEGEDAVVEWVKGTSLRPFLERLEGQLRESFLAAYAERVRPHYPSRPDGRTLLPFRRLFLVAVR